MGEHVEPGHPYVETKNHACKGIVPQDHMGGGGVGHSFNGKSMRLGGGGRFSKGQSELESKGYSEKSAGAIMASAGRKKYGAKKMSAMSAAGRKGK